MALVTLRGLPTDREIEWLSKNIGERKVWLPHYISGAGWKIRKTNYIGTDKPNYEVKWTLEFDDDQLASYYILKFK